MRIINDIFSEQYELTALRQDKGWTQEEISAVLGVKKDLYARIELGRVKAPQLIKKAKDILNSNMNFLFYCAIPTLKFKPMRKYVFITHKEKYIDSVRCLRFLKSAQGANHITHYLFQNQGGTLESFTATQLKDYKIQEG